MVRRVSSGGVEVRRLGLRRGWDTTEICTNDIREVGKFLSQHKSTARVWISAEGTVHYGTKGLRGKGMRAEHGTITLNANTEAQNLLGQRAQDQASLRMESFRNPKTGDLDIEQFCVKIKEPF